MSAAAPFLPPVPAPPHDPLSILLDVRAGWRLDGAMDGVEVAAADGALTLAPLPGTERLLASPDGSFGGLAPPANVALLDDGSVLLLDAVTSRLLRFDPCTCQFEPVPCTAGAGPAPRQLSSPGGIAVACGNLLIADTGNARVQVFAVAGFVLRALWAPPSTALPQPWQPVDVAADARGRVFVADPANGSVHLFDATGRWRRAFTGLGAVRHLVLDCRGHLLVTVEGQEEVRVLDPEGLVAETRLRRADEAAAFFPELPIVVHADGTLDLGALCVAGEGEGSALFDGSGTPVVPGTDEPSAAFPLEGTALTGALDSGLHRCVWDRLELAGSFPDHTAVRAFAYTSETELPQDLLLELATRIDLWSPCPVLSGRQARASAASTSPSTWDCLLRAPPGRYLWLMLVLEGDGYAAPRIEWARLVFPRVSLRRYLPGVFGADPIAADFTDRFLALFDRELRTIERTLDRQAHLFDPLSAPTGDGNPRRDFLSWIASWIGVTLDRGWPEARRRHYLKEVGRLLPLRGTLRGLQRQLALYLGLDRPSPCPPPAACGPCAFPAGRWRPPELVLEHYRLRRWLFLGQGRLGDQARLWGEGIVNRSRLGGTGNGTGTARAGQSQLITTQDPKRDPFHVYAHRLTVFAPAAIARAPGARRGLERLVRAEAPAHTAFDIKWVEPRFRIGVQSMIGFDTVVGRLPEGVTLSDASLGRATVLGPSQPGGEALSVGQNARLGTTTRLN